MIYKINGEQPFQVLSDSFSVSPSESGYDLYLSADGFNYSNFASVGSGITRQFTGMNNGNYYKLVGNTSEVSVNWERECHSSGGGGTAGVSSLDGQTGALTTKTINGNAILGSGDIVISGGSEEQNYQIVDDLSAITTPYAGLKVYVRGGSTTNTWTGYDFDASMVSGDYVAKIYKNNDPSDEVFNIYKSGSDFYWSWNNDGNLHQYNSGDFLCAYRANTSTGHFEIFMDDWSGLTVDMQTSAGVTSASTSTGVTTTLTASNHTYNGAEWVSTSDIIYDLDSMTQAERAALVAHLSSLSEVERIGAHIYKNKTKCVYNRIESGKIGFYMHNEEGWGYPELIYQFFFIKPDGDYEMHGNSRFANVANFNVSYTAHTISEDNCSFSTAVGMVDSMGGTDGTHFALTLALLIGNASQDGLHRIISTNAYIERSNPYTGRIIGYWEYSGSTIRAEWSIWENTPTLVSWSETPEGGSDLNLEFNQSREIYHRDYVTYTFTHTGSTWGGSNPTVLTVSNGGNSRNISIQDGQYNSNAVNISGVDFAFANVSEYNYSTEETAFFARLNNDGSVFKTYHQQFPDFYAKLVGGSSNDCTWTFACPSSYTVTVSSITADGWEYVGSGTTDFVETAPGGPILLYQGMTDMPQVCNYVLTHRYEEDFQIDFLYENRQILHSYRMECGNYGSTCYVRFVVDSATELRVGWAAGIAYTQTAALGVDPRFTGFGQTLAIDVDTNTLYYNGQAVDMTGTTYSYMVDSGIFNCIIGGYTYGSNALFNYYALSIISGGTEIGKYTYPIISSKPLASAVTIDGFEYDKDLAFDYGEWVVRMYANNNNCTAYFRVEHRQKVQGISQSDYDALVSGGTVDSSTLYVII